MIVTREETKRSTRENSPQTALVYNKGSTKKKMIQISEYLNKKEKREIRLLPQSERQKVNSSFMKDKTIKILACKNS